MACHRQTRNWSKVWRPYELSAFEIQEIVTSRVAIQFWSLVDMVEAITF